MIPLRMAWFWPFVPGIHDFSKAGFKGLDGWDAPGRDGPSDSKKVVTSVACARVMVAG